VIPASRNRSERSSLFFWFFLFLDRHVLQFTGLENVSTFLTFHIFRFFVAGDDLHPRMLAQFGADFSGRGLRRLARRHKLVDCSNLEDVRGFLIIGDILRRRATDVKYPSTTVELLSRKTLNHQGH